MSEIQPLTEDEAKAKFALLAKVTLNMESIPGLESYSKRCLGIAKAYAEGVKDNKRSGTQPGHLY